MAVSVCRCGAIDSIVKGKCYECNYTDPYGNMYICSTCMFEGLNGNETCKPCREKYIYDSVPFLPDPPTLNTPTFKKVRLVDRYSKSRWTRASKPDRHQVNTYWKRLHKKSIEQFRSIKYA